MRAGEFILHRVVVIRVNVLQFECFHPRAGYAAVYHLDLWNHQNHQNYSGGFWRKILSSGGFWFWWFQNPKSHTATLV